MKHVLKYGSLVILVYMVMAIVAGCTDLLINGIAP